MLRLSSKLRFAIKVSLSLTLSYVIPMAMGWAQPNTAAMTVMLIASAGAVSDGVSKGMIRVIGTVIGAIIGMILIALFPQERMIYLISMSLIVSMLSYLYYAYQGDSTVLMLSAMMVMMLFLNGVEDAFLYGVDRTYMTLFGILMYTFVGVFLWPVKPEKETLNDAPKGRMFVWLDPEYFKATLQLFLVFWFSVAFWIYFNPPAGFLVVMLATLLGLLTAFSPLKPSLLILLFSIGFAFAALMYTAVLPSLVYAWQLALFIFTYTFIAFYLINPKITIFFLIGMFTLGISNEMAYNFDVFLMTLLAFYMFLIILMFFYNFPFSSRPEHLFSLMKERFIKHSEALVVLEKDTKNRSFLDKFIYAYHTQQLKSSIIKMQLWGSKVDTKHFWQNTPEHIEAFSSSCLAYLKQETKLSNCYERMEKINWQCLKVNRF
ncbi:hypothetical protein MNB_SM-4-1775 [hydrothermal vent metagenome]|uniref:FUSC family protein n=1 Tax=hydrothermal vent metagenome TaxID=652676 RepID=A0A1W1C9K6_9ZZZZ